MSEITMTAPSESPVPNSNAAPPQPDVAVTSRVPPMSASSPATSFQLGIASVALIFSMISATWFLSSKIGELGARMGGVERSVERNTVRLDGLYQPIALIPKKAPVE